MMFLSNVRCRIFFPEPSRVRLEGVKVETPVSRQGNKVLVRGYGNAERAVRKPKIGNCASLDRVKLIRGSGVSPLV